MKVIVEGEESDIERFAEALRIRNVLIDVTDIKIDRLSGLEGFDGFHKTVGEDETDGRLDKSAEYLKVLIDVTKDWVQTDRNRDG